MRKKQEEIPTQETALIEPLNDEKLEKIKEYRDKDKQVKKEEKKTKTIGLKKELLRNSLIALGFELYFFLIGVMLFYGEPVALINILVCTITAFVVGGIIVLELSYRKERVRLAFTGAELIAMASASLVFYNLFGRYSPQTKLALLVMQCIMLGYFIVKAIIMLVMRKKGKL